VWKSPLLNKRHAIAHTHIACDGCPVADSFGPGPGLGPGPANGCWPGVGGASWPPLLAEVAAEVVGNAAVRAAGLADRDMLNHQVTIRSCTLGSPYSWQRDVTPGERSHTLGSPYSFSSVM